MNTIKFAQKNIEIDSTEFRCVSFTYTLTSVYFLLDSYPMTPLRLTNSLDTIQIKSQVQELSALTI